MNKISKVCVFSTLEMLKNEWYYIRICKDDAERRKITQNNDFICIFYSTVVNADEIFDYISMIYQLELGPPPSREAWILLDLITLTRTIESIEIPGPRDPPRYIHRRLCARCRELKLLNEFLRNSRICYSCKFTEQECIRCKKMQSYANFIGFSSTKICISCLSDI